jgi:hypothetical protein
MVAGGRYIAASESVHDPLVPAVAVTAGTASSPPSGTPAAISAALRWCGFLVALCFITSERPFRVVTGAARSRTRR